MLVKEDRGCTGIKRGKKKGHWRVIVTKCSALEHSNTRRPFLTWVCRRPATASAGFTSQQVRSDALTCGGGRRGRHTGHLARLVHDNVRVIEHRGRTLFAVDRSGGGGRARQRWMAWRGDWRTCATERAQGTSSLDIPFFWSCVINCKAPDMTWGWFNCGYNIQ